MRIGTRIRLSAIVVVIIAVTAGVVLLVGLRSMDTAVQRGHQITGSLNHVFELSMLTTDYLINHEPRAERQWRNQYDALDTTLSEIDVTGEEDTAALGRVRENLEQAGTTFSEITVVHARGLSEEIDPAVALEYESRLASRLLMLMQSMVSDMVVLGENAIEAARAVERTMIVVVMLVSGVGVLAMVLIGISADRSIIKPLESLRQTASQVGCGNLDVRSGIEGNDEVGEFAASFDNMVVSLQDSRAMLESEVAERRHAEEALGEYRDHLEQTVHERTSELILVNEDLQRATAAKDDFLASMSHELRTPLNSVIGFTDLMLKGRTGEFSPEQQRQIGMVHDAGRQLLALVNEVLELSRIDAGVLPITTESFDPAETSGRLVEMMVPVAEEKGLALRWSAREGVPGRIVSDRGRVEQILLNLLSNAIKFTEQGSVELTVRPEGSDTVVFDVRDTGIGIPPDECDAIFEHFHQVQAGPINESGTGLGLSISRRLAEVLGGTLTVTSEVGVGSTFTLSLPVVKLDADNEAVGAAQ